ncbi:Outer membrane receptor proteins, mostly Fe transport [Chitinophaga jiangningensis]|uniref:Outer membrane receptor proteins, mostly Fe transport n=1 Tax=Chitinophaga jiangningensis TaxID=1419482 RepID=A0A1M7KXK1_9BACT|nr:outer membrane beta-barrel protein [Chitinophaga jiangningensis]SHM70341.1 Outer membrane receptor proteins, mostly Fe transport [Chitinophaga jiangningensis]
MRKLMIALGMLMHLMLTANAQKSAAVNGTISVKVSDKAGKPLPFASILLRKTQDSSLVKGELSTENGTCNFSNIPEGEYFIQASQMGFSTHFIPNFQIDASHKKFSFDSIALEPLTKSLQAVNVTAQKPYIEREPGKTILNVESSPTAAGNTALDLLRKAPGVNLDNNENVILQGKSVQVMVDGKLTYLSGEQLTNLLKSTPAENIAQIELMTTPPAKYDASGNGGIINIKTKKGKMTGINGSVNGTFTQGWYPQINGGGNFNWRTEKFNLYGNGSLGEYRNYVQRDFRRTFRDVNDTSMLSQDIKQKNKFNDRSYKAGLDYFINDKHTVGVLVNGYNNSFSSRIPSTTNLFKPGMAPDSILSSYTTNDNNFDNIAVNLNYKGVLDTMGKEISVDADYANFRNQRHMILNDSMLDNHTHQYRNMNGVQNNAATNITIKSLKTDMVFPWGKQGKLETGAKVSFVSTNNVMLYDSLQSGKYVRAYSQSDEFDYQEDVYAAYASYKKSINKTSFNLGGRLEYTRSNGYSHTMDSTVVNNYLNFFPNISVEQKINDKNKLSLSYTRRIDRPEYGQLNPFIFYLDRYTYRQGNPFLKPQYTSTGELSYVLKDKYIFTFNASRINHIIEEFLTQDNDTKITTSTDVNYNHADFMNLNVTVPIDVTKWWHMDNNVNLSYASYLVQVGSGPLETRTNYSYSANTTQSFSLPKDYKIELTGFYQSPFIFGIFKGDPQYNANLGIQKTFLEKKATVKLNVNNLLSVQYFRGRAQYGSLDMSIYNIWQYRTVGIYFSYKFGSNTIKAARDRQTGASAEAKRAG